MKTWNKTVLVMLALMFVICTTVSAYVSVPLDRMTNAVYAYPPGTITGQSLQDGYDYLTSSDRDAAMGTIAELNPRTLVLTAGKYTSTSFILDTNYVNIKSIGDVVITDTSGAVIDCGSVIAKISGIKIDAPSIANGLTNDASITTENVTIIDGTNTQILDKLSIINMSASTTTTLTAAQSGQTFVLTKGGGTDTFTLVTAAVGLTFTFIDPSATSNDSLFITASSGDSINSGTVAKSYTSVAESIPASVTIVAVNAGSWEVKSQVGTWSNDNS